AVRYPGAFAAWYNLDVLGDPTEQRPGMELAGRPILARANSLDLVLGVPLGLNYSRAAHRPSAHQFSDAGRSEFPLVLHYYLLRLRRALRQYDEPARVVAIAVRLRRHNVRTGAFAGGLIRDSDAGGRRNSA